MVVIGDQVLIFFYFKISNNSIQLIITKMVPTDSLVLAIFVLLLVIITYVIFRSLQGQVITNNKKQKNIPGVPTPPSRPPFIPGVPTPGAPSALVPVVPVPGGNIRSY